MTADLIIFDCDGTLSRSDEAYFRGFCDALEKFGYPVPDGRTYQDKYSGLLLRDIIEAYGEDHGLALPPEVERYYWLLEQPYLMKYTMAVEGAADAIDLLQKKYKTCVASNAPVAGIEFLLGRGGLSKKFLHEHLFSAEHVGMPKPAPDIFLHASETMGIKPEKCIVIEDSTGGVRAGVTAGMRVIGFAGTAPHPAEKISSLLNAGATAAFASWSEITAFIESST